MSNKQFLISFLQKVLKDEELLRLLYYKPTTSLDDPLDKNKPNVIGTVSMSEFQNKRIILAPKIDDLLKNSEICRVCMYMSYRVKTHTNHLIDNQGVTFDIYTHIDSYELKDIRSLMICDRVNELFNQCRMDGAIGKIIGLKSMLIPNPPSGYIGYRLVYEFETFAK